VSGFEAPCGVLLVDKPSGMTSHDVVAVIRRAADIKRVGHGGTLDPMATGLLVVLVGSATRLGRFFLEGDKTYRATIAFGAETDTHDAEGGVVETAPVPPAVTDAATASEFVAGLVGEHEQQPPAFSAVKVDGRKSYELAREGRAHELEPRTIAIRAATLAGIDPATPSWDVELSVSKGTYVRALARDVGRAMETRAHLSALRRVASGRAHLDDAHALDTVESAARAGDLEDLFVPAAPMLDMPIVDLDDESAQDVTHGRTLALDEAPRAERTLVALTHSSRLAAVYVAQDGILRAEVVLPGGCA
jgi:tRNA pseudouridine55 synthase